MDRFARFAVAWVSLAVLAHGEPWVFESETSPDRAQTAQRVDQLLAAQWEEAGVEPASLAGDGEFLRRAYLDLTGVIPPVWKVRQFLAEADPHKRETLVDSLLASPSHATHLASTWTELLLPPTDDAVGGRNDLALRIWLREQFVKNRRYDNLVADLLVSGGTGRNEPTVWLTALDLAPEKIAATTSRIFLGIQMNCAQCHDHPFADWEQQDFWGFAAFFARLERAEDSQRVIDTSSGEVVLPDTEQVVAPHYPGGGPAGETRGGSRRQQLAIWMVSRENPYLAQAAANWAWSHLFGRGIIEPIGDAGTHNPASHPELLNVLAEYFLATQFDLRELLRMLTSTEAYQRSSGGASELPAELFAAMPLRPLTPAQLYDSLTQVSLRSMSTTTPGVTMGDRRLNDPQRQEFIQRLRSPSSSPTEYHFGLPQALFLMNGPAMTVATGSGTAGLLDALETPFFDDPQRIEILDLATLSRLPTDAERTKMVGYLADRAAEDRRASISDVLWVLLNSAEFTFNH